jgi:hypothetical protein
MIASAKPFLPKADNGKDTPLPSERPFSLGASMRSLEQTSASEKSASEATSSDRSQMRSRSASADPRMELPAPSAPAPAVPRNEAPMLGLMSGRGLY